MTSQDWRAESVRVAERLGFDTPSGLPLLEREQTLRPVDAIVARELAMFGCSVVAYGFSAEEMTAWLEREGLWAALTPGEAAFLRGAEDATSAAKLQQTVEAQWALAWVTRHQEVLLPDQGCAPNFIKLFPRIRTETSEGFRSAARMRAPERVGQALDTHYYLHWLARDATLNGRELPRPLVPLSVLQERRRALEWVTSEEDWDGITLDT